MLSSGLVYTHTRINDNTKKNLEAAEVAPDLKSQIHVRSWHVCGWVERIWIRASRGKHSSYVVSC